MIEKPDIHEYLAELDDIPGTRIYTAARARKGYHINQFAMSLMKAENRERFKADEDAYLNKWPISDAAKAAVRARDYNALLDLEELAEAALEAFRARYEALARGPRSGVAAGVADTDTPDA